MVRHFRRQSRTVNRKHIQRLMRLMGIEAVYPKPPHQVWGTDITYVSMARGFMYLMAGMDWHSRKILSWRLSNTPDSDFCNQAIQEALSRYGAPEIFNTDQGFQFTSNAFTQVLKDHGIAISMDGRGWCQDNIFVERLGGPSNITTFTCIRSAAAPSCVMD
jgi:putative transposase